jgi:hypothetical protein
LFPNSENATVQLALLAATTTPKDAIKSLRIAEYLLTSRYLTTSWIAKPSNQRDPFKSNKKAR